jgi:hypothetical protein
MLLLHRSFTKTSKNSYEETSLPAYLKKNTTALALVLNLCVVDLSSVIILFIIVPNILANDLSFAETCAVKVTAFCFINLGTTLTTFYLTLERWIKISYFEKHEKIFSKCTTVALVTSVWMLTLSFCTGAYIFVSLETSSSALPCRTSSLLATPMLLTKPSLVLLISTAMFVLYGDIILKFWSLKSRKERLKRKQMIVSRGNPYFTTQNNLFKGFSSEPVFDKKPPVILTGFKICDHPGCKMRKKSKHPENLEDLLSETRMRKIFRYLKDSKYVLCILVVYFFSWVTWLLTFFPSKVIFT